MIRRCPSSPSSAPHRQRPGTSPWSCRIPNFRNRKCPRCASGRSSTRRSPAAADRRRRGARRGRGCRRRRHPLRRRHSRRLRRRHRRSRRSQRPRPRSWGASPWVARTTTARRPPPSPPRGRATSSRRRAGSGRARPDRRSRRPSAIRRPIGAPRRGREARSTASTRSTSGGGRRLRRKPRPRPPRCRRSIGTTSGWDRGRGCGTLSRNGRAGPGRRRRRGRWYGEIVPPRSRSNPRTTRVFAVVVVVVAAVRTGGRLIVRRTPSTGPRAT